MKETFEDYSNLYPDLVYELIEFFDLQNMNRIDGKKIPRKIIDFVSISQKQSNIVYQPDIIDQICQKMTEKQLLNCQTHYDGMGFNNTYMSIIKDRSFFNNNKDLLQYAYNSKVYGFPYIYKTLKKSVLPIITYSEKEEGIGTCFKMFNGLVTAKHCIEDAHSVKIPGYTAETLSKSKILYSNNPGVDIAFIETNILADPYISFEDGKVLDDVLVMGYPRIPTFLNFCTGEKASISSKASTPMTSTKGSIAAKEKQYVNNIEALLITAKIRGGNSGGPVINENGNLVAVACQVPDYSKVQNFDELGYGIAVPSNYLKEMIVDGINTTISKPKDFWKDGIDENE